jgi:uncharacterized membrane protein HdeD (DUF308 family)
MNSTLTRIWWLLALRGGLALIFGILACFWPGLALIYMLVVFVTFALVDGEIALAAAIRGEFLPIETNVPGIVLDDREIVRELSPA